MSADWSNLFTGMPEDTVMYLVLDTNRWGRRRGFTLVEMLVVVALLILMMTILASIFQQATGAISVSRTYQELDNNLKFLDQTIRADLSNITAKMTPPNNPANKSGYFEYGENAPADPQGEDTDDYLAFTVKALPGQPFVGRTWLSGATPTFANQNVQPVTITSDYAEVIYFLRNGNLYRRVLLVVPDRQPSVFVRGRRGPSNSLVGVYAAAMYGATTANPVPVTSWLSVNDISARPTTSPAVVTAITGSQNPVYNSLADLTNRENRFARRRFHNDYWNTTNGANGGYTDFSSFVGLDGIIDDGNFDGLPDYYPTLTASQVQIVRTKNSAATSTSSTIILGLMNEDPSSRPGASGAQTNGGGYHRVDVGVAGANPLDVYAFPFINPNMYSMPETASVFAPSLKSISGLTVSGNIGWLHAIDNRTIGGSPLNALTPIASDIVYNHAPLEFGDSIPGPREVLPANTSHALQTWWGFPTFRETASGNYRDPIDGLATGSNYPGITGGSTATLAPIGNQVEQLRARPQNLTPAAATPKGFTAADFNSPPVVGSLPPFGTPAAPAVPYGFDGAGNSTGNLALVSSNAALASSTQANLAQIWDDDLIMTGVRSFDVKAYDPKAPLYNDATGKVGYNAGYFDLGYAATDYVKVLGDPLLVISTPKLLWDASTSQPQGFGHEGRMPPLTSDNRLDPQRAIVKDPINFGQFLENNIGDDTDAAVSTNSSGFSTGPPGSSPHRLRRVWDSWSTDYTNAPSVDVNLRGATYQAAPLDRPIYPSYPPPYPEPLRGIQIQIRVTDVKNERVKILTIRQDFSDKL